MLFVDRRPLDRVVERLGVVAPPALPLLGLHHAMETSSRCGKGTAEEMAERRGGKQKRGRGGGEMGKERRGEGRAISSVNGEVRGARPLECTLHVIQMKPRNP